MPGPELNVTDAGAHVERTSYLWPTTRAHLKIGWWMLLAFLTGGIVLEAMHGFKIGLYLNVGRETTRWMWTMTHATGAILGIVHVAFAVSVGWVPKTKQPRVCLASACLNSASLLLPAAFFLGGILPAHQSRACAVLLASPGAVLFATSVLLTALSFRKEKTSQGRQ